LAWSEVAPVHESEEGVTGPRPRQGLQSLLRVPGLPAKGPLGHRRFRQVGVRSAPGRTPRVLAMSAQGATAGEFRSILLAAPRGRLRFHDCFGAKEPGPPSAPRAWDSPAAEVDDSQTFLIQTSASKLIIIPLSAQMMPNSFLVQAEESCRRTGGRCRPRPSAVPVPSERRRAPIIAAVSDFG
jgi:hypothetical protein